MQRVNEMLKVQMLVIFLFLFSVLGFSQKLYQEEKDILKIKDDKNIYIGKLLKVLLNEIQPPIKMAYGDPSNNINSKVGFFRFTFVDYKRNDSLRAKGKIPITLTVYVKEYFDWDFQKRSKGKETVWTSADAKRYENLTIVGFRVYGDTTIVN